MAQFTDISGSLSKLLEAANGYNRQEPDAQEKLLQTLSSLMREVEGPHAYLSRVRSSPLLNMCLLVAIETGVLNAIVQKCGQTVTAGELAETTKRQESLIVRFMRLLTLNGVCEETAAKTYRANETATLLNEPEQVGAIRIMVEFLFPIGGKLVPQLRHERGLSEFADSPGDTTPFRATFGMNKFDYLQTDAEHKTAFDNYMAGRRKGIRRPWFEYYPLSDRLCIGSKDCPDGVFIVDVGGGLGHDIVNLKQNFGDIPGRFVLQDLGTTLEGVDLKAQGIEAIPHSFFEAQPVQGARAYYFRAIMHDWSDDNCRKILSQTAKAMTPGYSKVIIEDMVLPDTNVGSKGANLDVLMFMMVEGIERTLDQWKLLLDSSGLEISGIWAGGNGAESTIEAVLKSEHA